jgi:hypothetical protein
MSAPFLRRYGGAERVVFYGDISDGELAAKLDFNAWAKRHNLDECRATRMAVRFVTCYRSRWLARQTTRKDETRVREQFDKVISALRELRAIAGEHEFADSPFARNALHWARLLTVKPEIGFNNDKRRRIAARFPRREGANALIGAFAQQAASKRRAGRPISLKRVCADALLLAWFEVNGSLPLAGEFKLLLNLLDGILPDGVPDQSTVARALEHARKLYGKKRKAPWDG